MSSMSPFKQQVSSTVVGNLFDRASAWKGRSVHAAVRNPAYVKITANGKTIPNMGDDFSSVYGGGHFKPPPILKSVTIQSGGDFGLLLELHATIQCHTLDQFKSVESTFLHPGTIIDTTFGYGVPAVAGYSKGSTIKEFKVATYSFATTSEGFWEARLTAVAAGIAMQKIDMGTRIDHPGFYILPEGGKKAKVTNITELIEWDAQLRGSVSLEDVPDRTVATISESSKHSGQYTVGLAIYNNDHLENSKFGASIINNYLETATQNNKTSNSVYVSLEYIVNRLVNHYIFDTYDRITFAKDKPAWQKCKVKFDPVLSLSYPIGELVSAYPTQVLFIGPGGVNGDRGNYKNSGGKGKDFSDVLGDKKLVTSVIKQGPETRCTVDPKYIMINRDVIYSALGKEYSPEVKADKTDAKQEAEGMIDLESFFGKIFNAISEASGGSIKYRLSMHPAIHQGNANLQYYNELYIFDETNGNLGSAIDCVVFNPIEADQSTRSCLLTSEVGSSEYQMSLFGGHHKKAEPLKAIGKSLGPSAPGSQGYTIPTVSEILGLDTSEAGKAKADLKQIIVDPGPLADSAFDEIHMRSIADQLGTLRKVTTDSKKIDMLMYPGINMEAELDGIWGFAPGNAIISNQLPGNYFDAQAYFLVTSVTNEFSAETSDWMTKLSGMLAFHSKVNYKRL